MRLTTDVVSFGKLFRAVAVAMLVAAASGRSAQPLPPDATVQSRSLHDMWVVFRVGRRRRSDRGVGLLGWCIVRYRRRPGDTEWPVQFRRNDRMELVYTGIPILMVVALYAISYAAELHVETIARRQFVGSGLSVQVRRRSGLENVFDWTPNQVGTYGGECGEFCGLDHALMWFSVKVVPPADFERWVSARRGVALDPQRSER